MDVKTIHTPAHIEIRFDRTDDNDVSQLLGHVIALTRAQPDERPWVLLHEANKLHSGEPYIMPKVPGRYVDRDGDLWTLTETGDWECDATGVSDFYNYTPYTPAKENA